MNDNSEAHEMERDILLGPGNHTIKVQFRVQTSATTFVLDDWHLTVERADN